MFGLTEWQQTRFYRDVKAEGEAIGEARGKTEGKFEAKFEAVQRLLKLGLSVKQVAQALDLTVEQVEQARQNSNQNT